MRNKEELKQQSLTVNWLREEGHMVGSINNGMYTNSWSALRDNARAGTVRGLPDLLVILNGRYRLDGKPLVLFLEMKKEKGGVVSKEQKEWIDALNRAGVHASVCHGSTMAKDYVRSFYQEPHDQPRTEN